MNDHLEDVYEENKRLRVVVGDLRRQVAELDAALLHVVVERHKPKTVKRRFWR